MMQEMLAMSSGGGGGGNYELTLAADVNVTASGYNWANTNIPSEDAKVIVGIYAGSAGRFSVLTIKDDGTVVPQVQTTDTGTYIEGKVENGYIYIQSTYPNIQWRVIVLKKAS